MNDEQIFVHWRAARERGALSKSALKALYEFEAEARGYENVSQTIFSLEPIHDTVLQMVRTYPCAMMLDAGCGPNPTLDLTWRQGGVSVVALEYCFGYSRYAHRKAQEMRQALAIVNGDVSDLPFRSGVFDGCVCSEILEHTLEPAKALAELHRVLKPGGWLFLTVPNEANAYLVVLRLWRLLAPWKRPQIVFQEHPHHFQHFSRQELAQLFSGLFDVVRTYAVKFSRQPFSRQPVEYLLGKLVQVPWLRGLSANHALVLRARQ